jgi:hypothetical protein
MSPEKVTKLQQSAADSAAEPHKCAVCGGVTEWGEFSLRLGSEMRAHWFCEACFRKFAESNTMVLLMLNKLFPGVEWRKKKSASQESEVPKLSG